MNISFHRLRTHTPTSSVDTTFNSKSTEYSLFTMVVPFFKKISNIFKLLKCRATKHRLSRREVLWDDARSEDATSSGVIKSVTWRREVYSDVTSSGVTRDGVSNAISCGVA